MYRYFFKRIIDILFALLLLFLLSPILILLIIILSINNRESGVFFRQARPGHKGKVFKILKFKTMTDDLDENGILLPASKRITKIGRVIRSSSLDEIPQLINVLLGDMSVVGPRPLLIQYLSLYTKDQARRHEVRPGITGWAQTHGRNTISWQQKFEYDVWYVENISFLLDVQILVLTIKKVWKREDVNAGNGYTMPTFDGKN